VVGAVVVIVVVVVMVVAAAGGGGRGSLYRSFTDVEGVGVGGGYRTCTDIEGGGGGDRDFMHIFNENLKGQYPCAIRGHHAAEHGS
jgi:hypothetical protein